jgi:hypothetical protein
LYLVASALFVSCSESDDTVEIKPDAGNIAGEFTSDVTLDAANDYTLDGALIMNAGTLTIPAGTKITAAGGTTSYIAIAQGAKIKVEGSATDPVVMTADVEDYGQWGGLVICGYAPVNTGDGGLSEVGNLPYGGDDAADNSGSITYLRIEYSGYQYTEEKQFNGVSFFGVGSGTEVDYVSSYMGNDDGIEFFGGAVNASHLVSIESQDDGIDFADGWAGTGEYWYAVNSQKSGIEGSNNGDNGAATPMTTASLSKLTIMGMGEKPWFLKEGAGVQTIDDVVIGGLTNLAKAPYFYISSDDTDALAAAAAGDISITNVNFIGVADADKADASLTVGENTSATGAGSGAATPTWADGWAYPSDWSADITVLPAGNIAGEYSGTIILDASLAYTLDGALVVTEGGVLNIPAGTTITAAGGTTSYIAISQGAEIMVTGTASDPVVMTADVADYGQWGGLVICGYAPVNTGDGGLSEVGNLPYGGDDAEDNSGSIEYLRIEYSGYQYTEEKQFNGVSFFGVGSGTLVDYVSSYMGNDDGLEFFGGAVNASHIVSIQSQDDGIDFADGWSGTGEYWYSKDSQKSGIEGSNNGDNGAATPMTEATISNATIVGMGEKPWFLKEGAGVQSIDNVVIGGLTNAEKGPYFYISSDDTDALARAAASDISITNVLFTDAVVDKADASLTVTEDANATGAGNGADAPDWATGWAVPSK